MLPTTDGPESVDAPGTEPDEPAAGPTRFFFVVARQRMDLFLTIQRQFRGDPTVHVMVDRREHARRGRSGPIDFPDRRRRPDRRHSMDYWEDTAHHPAVIIPLSRFRPAVADSGPPSSAEVSLQDTESTTERVLVDPGRLRAWAEEGRYVIRRLLPLVFEERDTLKRQLRDALERGEALQEENDRLRGDVARATASHRQLEQAHTEIVDSVGRFLTQMAQALEPMRELAEKVGQARQGGGGTT